MVVQQKIHSPLSATPNAKDYIEIMCEIRKLALISDIDENVPTVVVFGDQSSGKSSVIQRLTGGLPMPRGSTKCTATPFEIRMLQSDEHIRTISLRYVEDKNRSPVYSRREVEFADITDMDESEIEEKLREAQRYVQNPSITDVKNTPLPSNTDELAFTRNAVCVRICGPEQEYSLSLVDLPGIVRDHEEHENFVLSLVKEYLKKDSSILVPIFQATSDIATQSAWRLAREADPTGQRTVGVLTKIDRIIDYPNDDEKHLELATLVKGKGEHQIVNGTYIIRNPSGGRSESSEDPEELEKMTIRALKQHRIWRDVPSDRFGLQNFTMKLSVLQKKAHELTWPKIRPFLEQHRAELENNLKNLPLPPDENPTIRFWNLIGNFDKEFEAHANTDKVENTFYRGQQWNFGQFDEAIYNTRPRYRLAFEEELVNEVYDPVRRGALQCRGWTKNLKDELSADHWGDTDDDHPLDSEYVWKLDQLAEVVQRSIGGQLVGYFPYKAVVSIVAKHQKEWFSISTKLLDKNHDWVAQFTDELVDNTFKEFPNAIHEIKRELRALLKECKETTFDYLKDIHKMEHMAANRALYVTDERSYLKKISKYFMKFRILATSRQGSSELQEVLAYGQRFYDLMYDEEADEDEFEKAKSNLINAISIRDPNEATSKLIEEIRGSRITIDSPSTATFSMMLAIKNAHLDKLIEATPKNEDETNKTILQGTINEQAFLAATGALAYWKMSHAKFREIVPRAVEYYLVRNFAENLGERLRVRFGLHGEQQQNQEANSLNLKDLLGEDPENAKNRKEWQQDIDNLSTIIDKVRKISVRSHQSSRK